ncbi:unnamed protein product [Staurois parvus]|uniref:Olfactory receptor n=1 Tax=Staurois parvus TaxID=386267 RepID=A0ABN9A6K3_9NEOB|nr:unnamed protein product [Staurois parvus]
MFFLFLLLVQCMTIVVNIFILLVVASVQHLHTPMYFFLCQLASAEMMFTINIIPNLLHIVLVEGAIISVIGCVIQFYIFSVSTNAESFFLTLMSYDRYMAICNPLHYNSLMSLSFCFRLAVITWIFSFSSTLIVIIQLCTLQFCGSNIIDHYYCDLAPLLEHSCSDVSLVKNTDIFFFHSHCSISIYFHFHNLPSYCHRCTSHSIIYWKTKGLLNLQLTFGCGLYILPDINNHLCDS